MDVWRSFQIFLIFLMCAETVNCKVKPGNPRFNNNKTIPEISCIECLIGWKGESTQVQCMVDYRDEKPMQASLYMGERTVKAEREEYGVFSTLTYTFVPNVTGNNMYVFRCTAEEGLEAATVLKVLNRASKPNITYSPFKEGQPGSIVCSSTGGPPAPTIKLKLNQTDVVASDGFVNLPSATFDVTLSRFDNMKEVNCCSTYRTFDGSDLSGTKSVCNQKKLKVYFPPQRVAVIEEYKDNLVNGDTRLILSCNVPVSNPGSKVKWEGVKNVDRTVDKIFDENETIGGRSVQNKLRANLTRDDNKRSITCVVTNEQFPDLRLSASYIANITYEPIVTINLGDSMTAYVGDEVQMRCSVNSNPKSKIVLYKENKEIHSRQNVEILDKILTNFTEPDVIKYVCTAWNGIASIRNASFTLTIKAKSEKPPPVTPTASSQSSATIPVVCALAVVVVIVAVVTGVVVYRKRRTDQGPTRSGSSRVHIEERKPSLHQPVDGPVYSNTDKSPMNNEPPVYASAVPKAERQAPSGEKAELIYADLDLTSNSKGTGRQPVIDPSAATEYVTIDFAKTSKTESVDETVYANST